MDCSWSSHELNADVDIRQSTPDDFEVFWQCLDLVARERRFLVMVQAPPLSEARAFLEEARSNGMIQFVAIKESRVIGWCDVTPSRWEGFRHSGTLGMGVLAEFRGHGIGKRLLRNTVEAAKDTGLRRIELEVFGSNRVAIALYRRHGFIQEGVKPQARVLDGVVDDVICMGLVLDGNTA